MSAGDRLAAAITRACAPDSLYWVSRSKSIDREAVTEIEVRLNLAPERILAFDAPPGWRIAHRDAALNAVFLRRAQALTDEAVKAMLADALTLAWDNSGRFHSWMHAPMDDW